MAKNEPRLEEARVYLTDGDTVIYNEDDDLTDVNVTDIGIVHIVRGKGVIMATYAPGVWHHIEYVVTGDANE